MHIPPYYRKESWQRFLSGCFIGAVIAYCIFLFMYGSMYERLFEENIRIQSELTELKKQNDALLQDKKDLNAKSNEAITVDKIEVNITNSEEIRLDRLIIHQLEDMVKQEFDHIIGEDVTVVAESDELLLTAIENKEFTIDDFTYSFEVHMLTISDEVKITTDVEVSEI